MSRVVLVTGGATGIGLACAQRFLDLGDKVAITYRSTPPPPQFFGVQCDVTSSTDVDAAFSAIENLTAAFRITKRATKNMLKARSGRVIYISSVVALLGSAGQANYAASKSGLVGLARSLARELGSRNITVNVVAPGPVSTAMTAALDAERLGELTAAVPLGRMATPEEIAGVVVFLAGPDAAYITGAVIPVDGGLGMGH